MAAAMWAASRELEGAGALATENTVGGIGAEVPVTRAHICPHLWPGESRDQLPVASWGQRREILLCWSQTFLFLCPPFWGNPWPGSCESQGQRDYFPDPQGGLTIQAAAAVEPIQRGWNKRGGPRAKVRPMGQTTKVGSRLIMARICPRRAHTSICLVTRSEGSGRDRRD